MQYRRQTIGIRGPDHDLEALAACISIVTPAVPWAFGAVIASTAFDCVIAIEIDAIVAARAAQCIEAKQTAHRIVARRAGDIIVTIVSPELYACRAAGTTLLVNVSAPRVPSRAQIRAANIQGDTDCALRHCAIVSCTSEDGSISGVEADDVVAPFAA